MEAGKRVADLEEQYSVSTKTIYGWLRQDSGKGVVSVLNYNKLKRENDELKRLIGERIVFSPKNETVALWHGDQLHIELLC